MKRETFNYIKRVLKDYPDIENHIKRREEELRHPSHFEDINSDIKGNYSDPDKMANMMITIEDDRRLAALERNKRIVDRVMRQADEDTAIIIEELYIAKFPRYTLTGLCERRIIGCSRNTASNKRTKFFELLARELNLDL